MISLVYEPSNVTEVYDTHLEIKFEDKEDDQMVVVD
jgi:hypothetical protein